MKPNCLLQNCSRKLEEVAKNFRNMSIWLHVKPAHPDAMFGIRKQFEICKSKKKVNLMVDGYLDDNGNPFLFPSVLKAEKLLHSMKLFKEYSPILGDDKFCKLALQLILGDESEYVSNGLATTIQCIAGTGSLRTAFVFIKKFYPARKMIYCSNPAWYNLPLMCKASDIETGSYRYYDIAVRDFDYKGMLEDINKMPNVSIILFYGCAHHPTGLDPTQQQWDEIAAIVKKKKHFPIFDMQYCGLVSGNTETDAYPVRKFVNEGIQCMWALSLSTTMGLYGERVGALTIITRSKTESEKVQSQLKILVRGLYSSPPINGSQIATKILEDPGLRADWHLEVREISDRITAVRQALRATLHNVGSKVNWDHLVKPIGLSSMSGFTRDQVDRLVSDFSVYLPLSGQIMFGGVNSKNIDYVARCFHEVTK